MKKILPAALLVFLAAGGVAGGGQGPKKVLIKSVKITTGK